MPSDYIRVASAFRKDREKVQSAFHGSFTLEKWHGSDDEKGKITEQLRKAVYASFLAAFAQGINIIDQANRENRWSISFRAVVQIWRNGCIIRSDHIIDMLEDHFIKEGQNDVDLLHWGRMAEEMNGTFPSLKRIVALGVELNAIIPSLGATLDYMKIMTDTQLPTQFYEAQLDYFGKHMYDLKSEGAGEPTTGKHHFEWKPA